MQNYPIDLLNKYTPDEIFMNKDRIKNVGEKLKEICADYKVYLQVKSARATSLAITYIVDLESGVNVKSLYGIKTELEIFLGCSIEIVDEGGEIKVSLKNIDYTNNCKRPMIGLRTIMESKTFMDSEELSFAAGIDYQGKPLIINIKEAPHILIAGSTGSGKSVFIDDIILSLIYKTSPSELKLLLIDPKYVELKPYNGIPHLLGPVVHNSKDAIDSFLWVEDEILTRYERLFPQLGVKTLDDYNKKTDKKLPRIVVIIDEYSDLVFSCPSELSQVIDRIVRLGRAAGIHLILATQLPIAKVVTSQIKANIPCRVSFTLVDGRESKVVIDKTGAERLLGNGDMLYSQSDSSSVVHAQAAYVSDTEMKNIIRYIKNN